MMVLLALLVAACGTPVPTLVPLPSGPPPTSTSDRSTMSGSLSVWHTYTANAAGVSRGALGALNTALDQVRAENPGLQLAASVVDLGELFIGYQLQGSSGTPDLVFAPNDNSGGLAQAGLAADLSAAFSADELGRFSQLARDGSTVEGKLVQVPATVRTVAVYYRVDRIAPFPATTDELLGAVQNGSLKLGLSQTIYPLFGLWGAFGGQLMDGSGLCIADSRVGDVFTYYAALKNAGANWYHEPDGYVAMVADFKSGALDAIIDGPWAGDGYRDAHPGSIAVAPLPSGPGGPALPMVGVEGWTINPHGTNQELAIAFAKRMTQPDILSILAGQAIQIPADPAVQPNDALSAQFAAAAQVGVARPQLPQLGAFWGNFGQALDSVIDDGADPQQAVSTACATMNSNNGL